MTEVQRLRRALDFLTSHLPGASELAEVVENPTYVLETNHVENPEQDLLAQDKKSLTTEDHQRALDEFKNKRLSNLEVGRLYERYLGYLYEEEGYEVTFKGVVDGFDDLGRDLIAKKGDEHLVIQAKCWSAKKRSMKNMHTNYIQALCIIGCLSGRL